MKSMIKTLIAGTAGAAMLVGCASDPKDPVNTMTDPPSRFKTDTIRVITGGPTGLMVQNPATPGCPGTETERKGCIIVPKDDVGLAEFLLTGAFNNFDMTRMWICVGDSKPEDWDEGDCSLPDPLNGEFEVFSVKGTPSPGTNGEINLDGVDQFYLINKNQTEQNYYYVIEACRTDNGKTECRRLDPRLRNGGIT